MIMYGARQVGKTYIIKEFGNHEFDNMVYVNCYKNDTIAQLFQGDVNIDRILIGLSAFTKQTITPGKTLVFLDEIQEIPPVLSSLKYFYENKPELHVIVAGLLLGVMNMKGESYPVGKVDIMLGFQEQGWMENVPLFAAREYISRNRETPMLK